MSLCSQAQGARGRMDVSIDTTQRRLTSRRRGWEHVAECIRQQRIVKLWMPFRDARAEFVARAPYRRDRGLLLQGTLIVRVALRAGPTCLCARPELLRQWPDLEEVRPLSQKLRMENMARWSAGVTFAVFWLPRPCLWPGHAHLDDVF